MLSWKQEVNQRLAAHRSRRDTASAADADAAATRHAASARAAQAAARVAARYANAPSYSQMLAEEARAALRAAEAATHAALKAQAAAESVLAELHTAHHATPFDEYETVAEACADPRPEPVQTSFFDPFLDVERPVAADAAEHGSGLAIRWEPDMPALREASPAARRGARHHPGDWRADEFHAAEPETVEPALPIPANLIEFPRELIAARRARPRIAEGPLASHAALPGQLSIFEMDPGTISIQPEPATVASEPAASGWSRMRLDAEPPSPPAHESAASAEQHRPIAPAAFSLRLLAALVDGALIAAVFFAFALATAANLTTQPSMRAMQITAALGLLVVGVLYEFFFFTFAEATPGMRYAGIGLSTFDDQQPTRPQLRRRIGAQLLSVLPVGLGLLWAIFDDDHLCWHDRISKTYQR